MAGYTYKDAIKGTLPTSDDTFYIHGLEYRLGGSNLYFSCARYENSKIFHLLGYPDANDLFREVLGEGNFNKAYGDSSPYALTYENARKILIKLWETPMFPIGTVVKIKPDLSADKSYGVFCNPEMVKYAGETVEIISKRVYDSGKYGYNVFYHVKHCGCDTDWWWTEDMFCETTVENTRQSEEKKCNPEISSSKELKLEQNRVNIHTSIQLPKHSKHLKITL